MDNVKELIEKKESFWNDLNGRLELNVTEVDDLHDKASKYFPTSISISLDEKVRACLDKFDIPELKDNVVQDSCYFHVNFKKGKVNSYFITFEVTKRVFFVFKSLIVVVIGISKKRTSKTSKWYYVKGAYIRKKEETQWIHNAAVALENSYLIKDNVKRKKITSCPQTILDTFVTLKTHLKDKIVNEIETRIKKNIKRQ